MKEQRLRERPALMIMGTIFTLMVKSMLTEIMVMANMLIPQKGRIMGCWLSWGMENYHAEVVHDDEAGTLMVYLLDSAAKNPVFSEASEVVINIRRGDQPLQFKLGGLKKDGQPEGKFSEYSLVEPELLKALHDKASAAKLSITIDGKPYSGEVSHGDHAAHDHAH
jgi:hypothetical protein